MSYSPTTWVTGTTPISAANLNKIEEGIVSGYTFTEYLCTNHVPTAGAWEDWDISAHIPAGCKFVEICITNSNASARSAGVRINGSALNRYASLVGYQSINMLVKPDASRIIEVYVNLAGPVFRVFGYYG